MAKKLRRKDLKKPDEFVARTVKLGEWVREHQRIVTFAAVSIVVVVIVVAVTVQLVERSRISSSDSLWSAMDVMVSPIEADLAADDESGAPEREPPAGYETFDTAESRAKAAVTAFERVVGEHEGAGAGQAAVLALATAQFSLGDYAKARQGYEQFLADPAGLDRLKAVAVEGIGYCYEGAENYDRALEKFRELEKLDDGRYRDLAQYHQGRMLEKLSKNDSAAELYRGLVRRAEQATDEAGASAFATQQAESRLAVIDPGADVLKASAKRRSDELLRKVLSGQGGRGLPPGLPPGFPGGAGPSDQ